MPLLDWTQNRGFGAHFGAQAARDLSRGGNRFLSDAGRSVWGGGRTYSFPSNQRGRIFMEINDKVADFTLETDAGKTVSLSDYAGKPVVLFFYPRADTPGCTIEACSFRDGFSKLKAAGAVVLGISRDTVKDQAKFKAKFDLPYTLLADPEEKVCNQFGVMKEKNMYGKKVWGIARTTFVIGPDRRLVHIFPNVTPEGHADEVLAYLKGQKRS
jgi:thioredoxin-dependent peroxiredoxin